MSSENKFNKATGATQVTLLRKEGKLEEAYQLAEKELAAQPNNIWSKRNMGWVLFDLLKQNVAEEKFEVFIKQLEGIAGLQLPGDEKLLFDQLSWQISKMAFALARVTPMDAGKFISLFEWSRSFAFTRPSEGYSVLFKALHKGLKETSKYIEFADWWGLENFRPEDHAKEKLPNGREVMSVVEQAYIAYAKHLLEGEGHLQPGWKNQINKEKVAGFLPLLDKIIETQPGYQYPPYFKAKLLLAAGDKSNMLSSLLPFARKKANDFWVWDILSEAVSEEKEKVLACYCKALTCKTPEEFLINIRQRLAAELIRRELFAEAKTEIERLVKARKEQGYKIPEIVANWERAGWYKNAVAKKDNADLYNQYLFIAEAILHSDIPEETVMVEFVNHAKKIVNFIGPGTKSGFFRYDRFLDDVNIGDVLNVRFNGNGHEGAFRVFSVSKTEHETFRDQYLKNIEGRIRISEGRSFGFINNVFVPPSLVAKYQLQNNQPVAAKAIRTFHKEKNQWTWKAIEIRKV